MDLELQKGEEKIITITYADSLDVSGATMSFVAKWDLDDTTYAIEKEHADFDMTNAATGIVTFELDNTDTATAGTLSGECTATFSATSLDRTEYITIWIRESVA
jgi:hypothetical protein